MSASAPRRKLPLVAATELTVTRANETSIQKKGRGETSGISRNLDESGSKLQNWFWRLHNGSHSVLIFALGLIPSW